MTPTQFQEIALSFAGAEPGEHMDHPDYRAHGRIFATLGYPDAGWGMVKLDPTHQKTLVREHPEVFRPSNGAWGAGGSTLIRLEAASITLVRSALKAAWERSAEPPPSSKRPKRKSR